MNGNSLRKKLFSSSCGWKNERTWPLVINNISMKCDEHAFIFLRLYSHTQREISLFTSCVLMPLIASIDRDLSAVTWRVLCTEKKITNKTKLKAVRWVHFYVWFILWHLTNSWIGWLMDWFVCIYLRLGKLTDKLWPKTLCDSYLEDEECRCSKIN